MVCRRNIRLSYATLLITFAIILTGGIYYAKLPDDRSSLKSAAKHSEKTLLETPLLEHIKANNGTLKVLVIYRNTGDQVKDIIDQIVRSKIVTAVNKWNGPLKKRHNSVKNGVKIEFLDENSAENCTLKADHEPCDDSNILKVVVDSNRKMSFTGSDKKLIVISSTDLMISPKVESTTSEFESQADRHIFHEYGYILGLQESAHTASHEEAHHPPAEIMTVLNDGKTIESDGSVEDRDSQAYQVFKDEPCKEGFTKDAVNENDQAKAHCLPSKSLASSSSTKQVAIVISKPEGDSFLVITEKPSLGFASTAKEARQRWILNTKSPQAFSIQSADPQFKNGCLDLSPETYLLDLRGCGNFTGQAWSKLESAFGSGEYFLKTSFTGTDLCLSSVSSEKGPVLQMIDCTLANTFRIESLQ